MKIAYIIQPVESSEYLIRCINSIYRQNVDKSKYYVILAENNFGEAAEKTEEYLSEKEDIIRIPNDISDNGEKLLTAARLVPEDADHIMFTYADTVFSPAAFSEIEKHEGSGIIIAASALKKNDAFVRVEHTEKEAYTLTSPLSVYDVILSKALFKAEEADKLCNNAYFHTTILRSINSFDIKVSVCDSICIYICRTSELVSISEFYDYLDILADTLESVLSNIDNKACGADRLSVYDECMSIFINCISSNDISEDKKRHSFDIIKRVSKKLKNDIVLNKLNELITGCTVEEIAMMDHYSYIRFRELSSSYNDKSAEIVIRNVISKCMADQKSNIDKLNAQIEMLRKENESSKKVSDGIYKESSGVRMQLEEVKKKDAAIYDETGKLKNDIAALSKNIHFLSQSVEELKCGVPAAVQDPLAAIPQTFADGKAGFAVIIKSIKAWFKYKFSRKSKN